MMIIIIMFYDDDHNEFLISIKLHVQGFDGPSSNTDDEVSTTARNLSNRQIVELKTIQKTGK